MVYMNFKKALKIMGDREYIEKFLIYNTSLVIAGIKPGVTIALNKSDKSLINSWERFGEAYLKEIQLKNIVLRESEKAIIVFIYDEEVLQKYINHPETLNFLQKIGYPKEYNVNDYVLCLEKRYNAFHCPHELGLFLGIPLEDVKDFIECTEKKCLLCGYWKVYNNFNSAKILFSKYDKVKQYTINSIITGILSRDLVVNIRALL